MCSHLFNGRPDFKKTNLWPCLSLSLTPLSLQHLLFSCQRRHVRRAKRTHSARLGSAGPLTSVWITKRGPFRSRLLAKRQLAKENRGGKGEKILRSKIQKPSYFPSRRYRLTSSVYSYNLQLSLKKIYSEKIFLFSSYTLKYPSPPKSDPILPTNR
jgi:hypothetical protein